MIALRNIYFHPLARYPGPKLWAAFRLRYCFSIWKGTLVHEIHGIHRVYGSFVRVAPDEISVASTDGWTDVHCRRPGHLRFFKNPIWWEDFPGRTPSIVSTTNPEDHRRFRAVLSTCFTPSAIRDQEPAVISHVDKMIDELRKRCSVQDQNTSVVNIVEWSRYIVFDILGDLGFGESFCCLENSALHPWVAELYTYTKVGSLVAALRHYTLIFKLIWRCIPANHLQNANSNFNWGVEKTHRRLDMETQREDFVSHIQQHNDNVDLALSLPELESNMNLLIQAGSDTCSIVLSGTINYLMKTPRAHKTLVHEVRSSFRTSTEMTFSNVARLPYLRAVAEEGLRLCPPAPGGLNRLVPPGGDYVCGKWLPGGVGNISRLSSYLLFSIQRLIESLLLPDACLGAPSGSSSLSREIPPS